MQPFYIGTAPFCNPSKHQCTATPGYYADEEDTCGDGSCCWSGKKIACKFSHDKWKSTPLFQEIMSEEPQHFNRVPEFNWFGKAPACSANVCDVYKAGMIPIKSHKCGDGSCCTTGEKWLGMRPILKKHDKAVTTGLKKCLHIENQQEKNIEAGLKFGSSVSNTLGSILNTIK